MVVTSVILWGNEKAESMEIWKADYWAGGSGYDSASKSAAWSVVDSAEMSVI